MGHDGLSALLGRQSIFRTSDLVAAGLTKRQIAQAVADGAIVRAGMPGYPERGIYAAPGADNDPDYSDCMVMVAAGGSGIIALQTASRRHGLTTALPHRWDVLVPRDMLVQKPYLRVVRPRRPESFTVGIEEQATELGIPIRITSRARTVVDLMRARDTNSDDWRHGIEALHTYLGENGDATELLDVAGEFEQGLRATVETAIHAYTPGGYEP